MSRRTFALCLLPFDFLLDHAIYPTLLSVAHASAVLQGPDLGRVSSSLDPPARLERLLRHGENSGGVPAGSPDLQPGPVPGGADRGIRARPGEGPISSGRA